MSDKRYRCCYAAGYPIIRRGGSSARPNINEMDIRAKSGVVQRVDMERLNSKPMIDMSLALQGTVPGLIVTNTGDLGSKPKIRIRGNSSFREGDTANEPLYVMDG